MTHLQLEDNSNKLDQNRLSKFIFCNSPGGKGKIHTVQKLQVVYKTFVSTAHCLTQKESVGLPKEKAEGGSNAATVFPTIACPLLVRKKINRGIIAAK